MAKKSTRKSAAKPHTLSFEQRLLQQLARAGRKVHRIDISNQLPIPDVVARELAPKIVAGDRIEFVQRGSDGREHVFAEWRWFVLFDAAMHRHGAPGWADAVISPLYIGQVHLEAGHWFAGYYRAADIVRGELPSDCSVDRHDARTVAGRGVAARFASESNPTLLGSRRWLTDAGLATNPQLASRMDDALARGESVSAIGWDGQLRGAFFLAETLRPEAAAALTACEQLGCRVRVLTGDSFARAEILARELHVAVDAELLPEQKVAALRQLRAAHGPTAMVGDGINDAPALAAADLGISLACGADISRESAAVCLLGDDLARVPWAIALARRSASVIRQNLFWAFSYNVIGVGLAAAGWLNPALAAAAMTASSALVIGNSLRLRKDPTCTSADNLNANTTPSLLVAPMPVGAGVSPPVSPLPLATR